ncbi:MAG: hypothetical protein IH802_08185 [Nitrospinae bacterium]|nr:hypothetical protein [Nitrospinota bacterium]
MTGANFLQLILVVLILVALGIPLLIDDEVCFETEEHNLFFAPCGVLPPNPVELLSIGMTRTLHDRLLEEFDLLIFD